MLPYINRQLSRSSSNQVTEEIPLYRGLVTLQTLHEKVKVKLHIHGKLRNGSASDGTLRPAIGVEHDYQETSPSRWRGRKMV
jgi:hypothetical protein